MNRICERYVGRRAIPFPFLLVRLGVGLKSILDRRDDLASSVDVSDMTRASGDLLESCLDSSNALSPRGKCSLQELLAAPGGARLADLVVSVVSRGVSGPWFESIASRR